MPPPPIVVNWSKVSLAIEVWCKAEVAFTNAVINYGNYLAVVNECKQVLLFELGL